MRSNIDHLASPVAAERWRGNGKCRHGDNLNVFSVFDVSGAGNIHEDSRNRSPDDIYVWRFFLLAEFAVQNLDILSYAGNEMSR